MSEVERPRRKAWQIHLSTSMVLLLIVGAILGVNLQRHSELMRSQATFCYGWPIPLVHEFWNGSGMPPRTSYPPDKMPYFIEWVGVIVDPVYWALLLFLFGFTMEWRWHWQQRLHVSSCLCLVILAGVLAFANFRADIASFDTVDDKNVTVERYGWPERTLVRWSGAHALDQGEHFEEFLPYHALSNVTNALIILWMTAFASEWLIRRREARKI